MGRLRAELLERAETFADRMLDVSEMLEKQRRPRRVIDQVCGCGTSPGANLFEADQAVSRKDFSKTIGITAKELGESKFWLRLIGRRGWIKPARLAGPIDETEQLLRIVNSMIVRTRARTPQRNRPTQR